jgi:hypothetical protein
LDSEVGFLLYVHISFDGGRSGEAVANVRRTRQILGEVTMFVFAERWGQVACVGACIVALAFTVAEVSAQGPSGRQGMRGGGTGHQQGGMGHQQGGMGHQQGGMGHQQGGMGHQQGMRYQRQQGMGTGGQAGMQPGQGMGPMQGMMGDAAMQNMPEPMRMRMRMMMDMQMDEHDPACLLAVKDDLGLTREQILALNKILADARRQAAALMTSPQRDKLRGLAKTPSTGRQMQRHMMQGGQGMQRGNQPPMR